MTDSQSTSSTDDSKRRSVVDEYAWVLPILLGATALALLIFLEPSWGANAAAGLGFLVSVVAIVVSVLIDRGVFRGARLPDALRRWQKKAVAASTAAAMIVGLAWWAVKREGDPFEYLSGRVVIGCLNQNYPGWHSRPENLADVHYGFEVAMLAALKLKFYDAEFEWRALDGLDSRETVLASGDHDSENSIKLVISNFSITPERQASIDFAGPYYKDVQGLLSKTGNRTPSVTENQLCGISSSTGADTIDGLGWAITTEPTLEKCMARYDARYDAGEVAGVSTDMSILQPYVKWRAENGSPVVGKVVDLQAIGTERYGIGIPNNRPKLCRAINEAIDDFLQDSWEATFKDFLGPAGVNPANKNPKKTSACEEPGPAFTKR